MAWRDTLMRHFGPCILGGVTLGNWLSKHRNAGPVICNALFAGYSGAVSCARNFSINSHTVWHSLRSPASPHVTERLRPPHSTEIALDPSKMKPCGPGFKLKSLDSSKTFWTSRKVSGANWCVMLLDRSDPLKLYSW